MPKKAKKTAAPKKATKASKKSARKSAAKKPQLHKKTNAAAGEHNDTNKPRLEEIKALQPHESPSNAHKNGVGKVKAAPNPMGTTGPIADTVGSQKKD